MKKLYYLLLLLTPLFLFSQNTNNVLTNINQKSESSDIAIMIATQNPDYPATPGDIYEISFLTAGNIVPTIINGFVDGEYDIDLSFIGNVNVKGLIYSDVQKELRDIISYAYPGSIIDIMIQAAGMFKVTLIGEVKEASIIDAMSLTTLVEIINNQFNDYGSYRDIEIRSEDGTFAVYDLFQFTRFANKNHNPYLKPNDVITVRPYKKSIEVSGEVKRPGIYQLIEGETLHDLINIHADGFTKLANKSNVEILSIIDRSEDFSDKATYIDATSVDLEVIKLNDFDRVYIETKQKFSSRVYVQGAINSPTANGVSVSNKITVPLVSGNKVSTIINAMVATFTLTSDLETSFILRGDEKIVVNLKEIQENDDSEFDIVMMDKDILIIPFKQRTVFVAGSVVSPGAVTFIENRTAEYYIGARSGYKRTENLFRTYTVTDVYGKKLKKDTIISPEDTIWVNRDHPMAYITEYGGWAISIAAILVAYDAIQVWTEDLNK